MPEDQSEHFVEAAWLLNQLPSMKDTENFDALTHHMMHTNLLLALIAMRLGKLLEQRE